MSDQPHGAQEQREIPTSAGLPKEVGLLLALAVLIIFMQAAFVIVSSDFGRIWPAENSVKIPLPPGV
jgi:hypothetical protein